MTEPANTSLRGRSSWWWALVALLPYFAVVIVRWDHLPSATDGDYAQYLLHAKALAEGRPYSDIGYIYTDMNLVGPRNQPPGWPIVLAPFVAAFGVHSPVIKLLVTFLVAGFAITAGLYFARRSGAVPGLAVTMAVPLALETGRATGSALSDPLCCLLIWLALLIADRDQGSRIRRHATAAALAIGATLVRVAGIALLPAVAAHAISQARGNKPRVVLAVFASGLAAGLVFALAGDSVPVIGRYVAGAATFGVSPVEFIQTYRSALTAGALFPLSSDGANDVYHVVIAIPLLVGALRFLRMEMGSTLWWFVFAYAGMLFVSPVREGRYAWPLIPLVMFWLVSGAMFLLDRVRSPSVRAVIPRYAAIVVGLIGIGAALRLAQTPRREALLDDPPTIELFAVVQSLADTGGVVPRVVFANPRVLTLETGVAAMGLPYGEPEEVINEFDAQAITHVVVPLHTFNHRAERMLLENVTDRPARFASVFSNSRYQLYRLLPVAEQGTAP